MDNTHKILDGLRNSLGMATGMVQDVDKALRGVLNQTVTPEVMEQMTPEQRAQWEEMSKTLNNSEGLDKKVQDLKQHLNNFKNGDFSN